jgi:hypothetical protein
MASAAMAANVFLWAKRVDAIDINILPFMSLIF